MKIKLIASLFLSIFFLFRSIDVKAQNDAFFVNSSEQRTSSNLGQGFNFGNMDTPQNGFNFETMNSNGVPLANGLLLMTATGLIYLMNKRRKENVK